jgi:hypothetical protein
MATLKPGSMLLGTTRPAELRAWYRKALAPESTGDGPIDLGGFLLVIDGRDDVTAKNDEPGRTIINFHVDDFRHRGSPAGRGRGGVDLGRGPGEGQVRHVRRPRRELPPDHRVEEGRLRPRHRRGHPPNRSVAENRYLSAGSYSASNTCSPLFRQSGSLSDSSSQIPVSGWFSRHTRTSTE